MVYREWYGHAPFNHPSPAALSLLAKEYFPALKINPTYRPSCTPPPSGETITRLHDRVAFALSHIISSVDSETGPEKDVAILICTHAATLIAIGRCLTGRMPKDVNEEDFLAPCAGITKFARREAGKERNHGSDTVDWRDGKGIGGGWECVMNGNCDHLAGGAERTW